MRWRNQSQPAWFAWPKYYKYTSVIELGWETLWGLGRSRSVVGLCTQEWLDLIYERKDKRVRWVCNGDMKIEPLSLVLNSIQQIAVRYNLGISCYGLRPNGWVVRPITSHIRSPTKIVDCTQVQILTRSFCLFKLTLAHLSVHPSAPIHPLQVKTTLSLLIISKCNTCS